VGAGREKEKTMKRMWFFLCAVAIILNGSTQLLADVPVSDATQECLDCHSSTHPGIVEGWLKSRHAATTPGKALSAKDPARKVSSDSVPEDLLSVVVGCAECHTLRPKAHKDTVEHNGYDIHVVVSPNDCATCHAVEADQYSKNLMAWARKNLAENSLYRMLEHSINGKPVFENGKLHLEKAGKETSETTCYYCHGTRLEVEGFETRDTDAGELEFAKITGWPNQGVGRINLDGSRGSCSACHTRHTFSIEMARKPYTCKECHIGPDVPAFKVYSSSKHGNIFSALNANPNVKLTGKWNFDSVPWTIGKDFTAPTCATCHVSLLVDTEGTVVAERTHRMSDRLASRIFGLIYAHAHPKEPDTTIIRNRDNQPLPTDFKGGEASAYLIDKQEQEKRTQTMQAVCLSCHHTTWVKGHWARYEDTVRTSNAATLAATRIMEDIWKQGFAKGLDRSGNPFNEAVERKWSDIWLFHTNTIRFAAAMAGGGDYGVFADGRYQLTQKIAELNEWLDLRKASR
jgi:hypothetical protein